MAAYLQTSERSQQRLLLLESSYDFQLDELKGRQMKQVTELKHEMSQKFDELQAKCKENQLVGPPQTICTSAKQGDDAGMELIKFVQEQKSEQMESLKETYNKRLANLMESNRKEIKKIVANHLKALNDVYKQQVDATNN